MGDGGAARWRSRFGPDLGAAHGAGIGLRVKAAVGRGGVLAAAVGTHLEGPHGSPRAVVGNIENDAIARSAVGAVGERIAEAAIGRIAKFREAGRAGCQVRQHRGGLLRALVASQDREPARPNRDQPADLPGEHNRWRRFLPVKARQEAVELRRGSLDLHHQAGARIQHQSRQAQFLGEPVDKGAEAHPLDRACQADSKAFQSTLQRNAVSEFLNGVQNLRGRLAAKREVRSLNSIDEQRLR